SQKHHKLGLTNEIPRNSVFQNSRSNTSSTALWPTSSIVLTISSLLFTHVVHSLGSDTMAATKAATATKTKQTNTNSVVNNTALGPSSSPRPIVPIGTLRSNSINSKSSASSIAPFRLKLILMIRL